MSFGLLLSQQLFFFHIRCLPIFRSFNDSYPCNGSKDAVIKILSQVERHSMLTDITYYQGGPTRTHSLYYSYPKLVVPAVLQSPIKMNYESRGVTHLPIASCASTPACCPGVSSKLGEEMDQSFNLQLQTATMAVLRTLLQRREMA